MRTLYIFCLSLILTFSNTSCDNSQAKNQKNNKEDKEQEGEVQKVTEPVSGEVSVEEKWKLPEILKEISGFAYLGPNRFACIQDESGVVFIYNTATAKIENQISFGAAGDYEGIAMVNQTAYVVRSDGQIFRIEDLNSKNNHHIQNFTTGLTPKNNVEGITYDQKNNRLLLAIKGAETGEKDYKGIYGFDLATNKMNKEPAYKINLNDPAFQNNRTKKLSQVIQPSDLAVNPANGNLYIIEGRNPQLVILNTQGNIINRYVISGKEFSQPEGIAFSPQGDLFISNEGKKKSGNIVKVTIADRRVGI